MELEVVSKRENVLLDRTEIWFKVMHDKDKTPKRDVVREKLASQLNVKKSAVIIDHMKSEFGKHETLGYAKVYKSEEKAIAIEPDYILKRNNLVVKTEEPKKESE